MAVLDFITQEGLVLIPALYIIGIMLKESDFVKDKYIPLLLLPLGIIGALALQGFSAGAIVQGVLISGACVYGNQIGKQLQKE